MVRGFRAGGIGAQFYGTRVVKRIARETGGMDFEAREKGEQLRRSYKLGYHSTNPISDNSFHARAADR